MRHLTCLAIFGVACHGRAQAPPLEAFKSGVVHYRFDMPGESEARPRVVRLAWDGTAIKAEQTQPAHGANPEDHIQIVLTGEDALTFMSADSVNFSRDKDFDFTRNPKYDLVARRPSMPLGVIVPGFPVVVKEGGRLAMAADSDRPNPFTQWTYEGIVDAGTGTVPRKAKMSSNTGTIVQYEILSARLGSLPAGEQLVPNWYRHGMQIVDLRVNPPVNWTYERLVKASGKKTGLTPDELLVLSQSLSKGIGQRLETRKRRESNQGSNGWLIPGGVGVSLLVIGTFAFLKRNRKGRLNQDSI